MGRQTFNTNFKQMKKRKKVLKEGYIMRSIRIVSAVKKYIHNSMMILLLDFAKIHC